MMPIDEASSTFTFTIGFSSYDVFLNFRGEDTRNNFAGILNLVMKDKGINVFMDSEKLWTGEAIGPACLRAIVGSKISIPIFSSRYADSKWCLLELSQIHRCHKTNGQLVLPIFIDIDPSHVRNQSGSFEEAFQRHEKNFESHIIETWRDALKVIGSLKGEVINESKDQAKVLESIVKRVSDELVSSTHLDECKYAIGMDKRIGDVLSLLSMDSNDVQFIGICGSQGIGKTTIVEALYNHMLPKFNRHSFISDVSKQAIQCMGLTSLQKRLLKDIFKVDFDISHYHRGKRVIKRMLCQENILLVLDDVDSKEQIAALVGEHSWVGPGSKVIITTRYEHILKVAKIAKDKIYWPKELDDKESLQLFSLHAFSMKEPLDDYMKLSRDVTRYSRGLPLTLEVLGSYLSNIRSKEEWKSTLRKLRSGKASISNLASLHTERRNNSLGRRPPGHGNMGNNSIVAKASRVFKGCMLDLNASVTNDRVGAEHFTPLGIFLAAISRFTKGYSKPIGSEVIEITGKRFRISEIRAATNNFDDSLLIGVGGFGNVYKGKLYDGTVAAFKRRSRLSAQGQDEFEREMFLYEHMENGSLSNENLVSIIGFCEENNELILVYELMEHGSLKNHLFESEYPPLTWKQRLEICIGVARGLHCLHSLGECGIVHRDIKPSNILLGENLVAKIADFGLSRIGPAPVETHVSTDSRVGTFGYMAPEYLCHGHFSLKTDVFSFGVVLFEVVSGRSAFVRDDRINIRKWALRSESQRSLEAIVDPRLDGNYSPESLKKLFDIARKCLEGINIYESLAVFEPEFYFNSHPGSASRNQSSFSNSWKNRPTMEQVLRELEYVLQLHEAWEENGGEEYSTHSSLIDGVGTENSRIRIESPLLGNEDSTGAGQEYSTHDKLVGPLGSEKSRTGIKPDWARFDDSSGQENSNYISLVGAIGSQNSRTETESAWAGFDDSGEEEYSNYFSAGCSEFSDELVSPLGGFEERTFSSRCWI